MLPLISMNCEHSGQIYPVVLNNMNSTDETVSVELGFFGLPSLGFLSALVFVFVFGPPSLPCTNITAFIAVFKSMAT